MNINRRSQTFFYACVCSCVCVCGVSVCARARVRIFCAAATRREFLLSGSRRRLRFAFLSRLTRESRAWIEYWNRSVGKCTGGRCATAISGSDFKSQSGPGVCFGHEQCSSRSDLKRVSSLVDQLVFGFWVLLTLVSNCHLNFLMYIFKLFEPLRAVSEWLVLLS